MLSLVPSAAIDPTREPADRMGVWTLELSSGAFECSSEVGRILGTADGPNPSLNSLDELLSHLHHDQRELVARQLEALRLGTGRPFCERCRLEGAGGAARWIDFCAASRLGAKGIPTHLQGAILNATREVRANEALRLVVDSAPDAVVITDRARRILTWNRRAESLFGWAESEVLGRPLPEVIRCSTGPGDATQLEILCRDGAEPEATRPVFEAIVRNRAGAEFPAEISVSRMDGGDHADGCCVFIRDLTERRRADEALRASEARLSAIIETTPNVAIQGFDRDGHVLLWNSASEHLFGFRRDEAMGKTLDQLIHTRDEAQQFLGVLRVIEERGAPVGPAEYHFRRKDGSEGDCLSTTFRVETTPGFPLFICMDVDITERKRLEEEVLHAQRIESIGRLAGGIAHDFNNILTSILGFGHLASVKTGPDSSVQSELKTMMDAARRGADLTRQLLAFARKQVIQPVVLDPNRLIEQSATFLGRLLGTDVDLHIVPGRAVRRVKADRAQLEQVLVNLAINARDAMPQGGRLTIEAENIEVDAAHPGSRTELPIGSYVRISVSDTGVGMTPDVRARVFEPFYTTKPAGKGTGLGLATCYGIIKQSSGHILVHSEVGKGTRFRIYLPALDNAEPAGMSSAPVEVTAPAGETILVVEDDPDVRGYVVTALTHLGYHVLTEPAGEEALERARSYAGPIHLVMTDIRMPRMGGRELAAHLAKSHPHTKVLFTSGHPDSDLSSGAAGVRRRTRFLGKPYSPEQLERAVREALEP